MIITDENGEFLKVSTGLLKGMNKNKLIDILQTQIKGDVVLVCNQVGNLGVMSSEKEFKFLGFIDFADEKFTSVRD